MTRRIVDFQFSSIPYPGKPSQDLDTYFDKVVKFVPADVVAAWTAVLGIVKPFHDDRILYGCFVFGIVFTAGWTWRQASSGKKTPYVQIGVSTLAFVVWVIAIGPPFESLLPAPAGSLLLIAFTLLSGLIYTGQKG